MVTTQKLNVSLLGGGKGGGVSLFMGLVEEGVSTSHLFIYW